MRPWELLRLPARRLIPKTSNWPWPLSKAWASDHGRLKTCASAGVIYIQQRGSANGNYVLTDSDNFVVASGMLNDSAPVTVAVVGGNYTHMLSDENNYVATKTISVMGGDMINASFNSSSTAITQNGSVTLTGTSTNATTYAWDFGNSSTATGQTVSATYTTPGVYTVQLTLSNA